MVDQLLVSPAENSQVSNILTSVAQFTTVIFVLPLRVIARNWLCDQPSEPQELSRVN
jgi:hypothetical protein